MAQQDIQPFAGRYPTNVWGVGEPITLDFTFTLPVNAPAGPYEWRVGAYSFPSWERLSVIQDRQSISDRRVYLSPLISPLVYSPCALPFLTPAEQPLPLSGCIRIWGQSF